MPTVERDTFPDEAPTARRDNVASQTMIRAARIAALAEHAAATLDTEPDAARADLDAIKAIAGRLA